MICFLGFKRPSDHIRLLHSLYNISYGTDGVRALVNRAAARGRCAAFGTKLTSRNASGRFLRAKPSAPVSRNFLQRVFEDSQVNWSDNQVNRSNPGGNRASPYGAAEPQLICIFFDGYKNTFVLNVFDCFGT
jgi:hypothetical protein